MVAGIDGLISVLLDSSATDEERDDAAMDLGDSDAKAGLKALVQTASDPEVSETVLSSCGESIGRIWLRRGIPDRTSWKRLQPAARSELRAYLQTHQPRWFDANGDLAD